MISVMTTVQIRKCPVCESQFWMFEPSPTDSSKVVVMFIDVVRPLDSPDALNSRVIDYPLRNWVIARESAMFFGWRCVCGAIAQ